MKFRVSSLRFQVPLSALLTITAAAVFLGLLIGVSVARPLGRATQQARDSRVARVNQIYRAWNDMAASMDAENKLLEELQENLKANPPHLVFDPRRPELYRQIIAEHRRQLKDFETMQSVER